jgi:uncharacterized protein YjbJ (UPF0337 family)
MKGKIKEVTGKLVGNKSLEVKGKVEAVVGEARAKLGDIKQEIKKEIRDSKKGA